MNKLRWGKFYWSDWSDDPALASCSLAAQGLWMRLLCIAAQGTPYGHVTINGKPAPPPALARIVRCKLATLERLVRQLERKGVCKRAASGALMCSRMEADGKLARARATAAKSRWNKKNGSDLHMQNSGFASPESDAELDTRVPPVGSPRGGPRGRASKSNGGRKASRNGFVDIALDMMEQRNAETDDARPGGARVVDLTRHIGRRKPSA